MSEQAVCAVFESWAEGQLAGFDKQARECPAGVLPHVERKRALLANLLDCYWRQGPNAALARAEWLTAHAERLSERWVAHACMEWLRDGLGLDGLGVAGE